MFKRTISVALELIILSIILLLQSILSPFLVAARPIAAQRPQDFSRATGAAPDPILELVGRGPADTPYYAFVARISSAEASTMYTVTTEHTTDAAYTQETVTVTTDLAGDAWVTVKSRWQHQDQPTGIVHALLGRDGDTMARSDALECESLGAIDAYGAYRVGSSDGDWVYSPHSPNSSAIRIWARDAESRRELDAEISISSASTGYAHQAPMHSAGGGLYTYDWVVSGQPRADDYAVHVTLHGPDTSPLGYSSLIKASGRAMWLWGEAYGGENPAVWAILANQDLDSNGIGDRDDWLTFCDAPKSKADDFVTTTYLSVYPYISWHGTTVTSTFNAFLTAAHESGRVRVEALVGDPEWVDSDAALAEAKGLCDAIIHYNASAASDAERFDGIHYDVERDNWDDVGAARWGRFIDLIDYCQGRVDTHNLSHTPIVFGVDIPIGFEPGIAYSNQVRSAWDVMRRVDAVTLMAYRDTAGTEDRATNGILTYAAPILRDGVALGKPVMIGVELSDRPQFEHVTFLQESGVVMEGVLDEVETYFAECSAFRGIAIHSYEWWRVKTWIELPLPLVLAEAG